MALLLVVVIGEGKLVVPVDFMVRRPDPVGPGRPCRDKLTWLQVMLDRTWTAWQRLGRLPAPLIVADQLVWRLGVAGARGAPPARNRGRGGQTHRMSSGCPTGVG